VRREHPSLRSSTLAALVNKRKCQSCMGTQSLCWIGKRATLTFREILQRGVVITTRAVQSPDGAVPHRDVRVIRVPVVKILIRAQGFVVFKQRLFKQTLRGERVALGGQRFAIRDVPAP
jgi:hypothetical protein